MIRTATQGAPPATHPMRHELDHIFIAAPAGARSADALVELGFSEGSGNVHPGQGTANRRFFFRNAMLEFLWICDADEARSELTRRTRLWERCPGADPRICPFGLCLRPGTGKGLAPPFPTWPYRPRYLPRDHTIGIATNSENLGEPMLFHLAFGERPDAALPHRRQPLKHAAGARELTRLRWTRPPGSAPSSELRGVVDAGLLSIGDGDAHVLELGFDDEIQGKCADLRSTLSLVLRW